MGRMEHDRSIQGKQGENLAYFGGGNQNPSELVKRACDMWYNEISNYNWRTGDKIRVTNDGKDAIGHFTQVRYFLLHVFPYWIMETQFEMGFVPKLKIFFRWFGSHRPSLVLV